MNLHLSSHPMPSFLLFGLCTFKPLFFLSLVLYCSDLFPCSFSSIRPSVRPSVWCCLLQLLCPSWTINPSRQPVPGPRTANTYSHMQTHTSQTQGHLSTHALHKFHLSWMQKLSYHKLTIIYSPLYLNPKFCSRQNTKGIICLMPLLRYCILFFIAICLQIINKW